ncbi:MAG: group 1 truncated hemoglobin [Rhodanobacteraceae bacterium]|nr:MAG: group 1 truncated hemoglobin [Rhodanobacteraceae bacterium]
MNRKFPVLAALIVACLATAPLALAQNATPASSAMSQDGYPSAPRDPSLKPVFAEFGGKAGLVSLMNTFMDNLMADPVTHPFFANVDRDHIKMELVDQFCVILDGPCTYTGQSMTSVHKGMGVTRADFNALVVDLQKAMSAHHIPFRAQNKLLAKLAPMGHQIITKP